MGMRLKALSVNLAVHRISLAKDSCFAIPQYTNARDFLSTRSAGILSSLFFAIRSIEFGGSHHAD